MKQPWRGNERTFRDFSFVIAAATFVPFAASMLASPLTRATEVDPTRPKTVVVGPSPGVAPMGGVDGARRGRAHHPLPDQPTVLWRYGARTSIDPIPLCVDARGAILVAGANLPELVELGDDGKERWRASTGGGPAVSGAVISNDGTRVVVTSTGDALGFSPEGGLRFTTSLDLAERNSHIGLLPLENGGVAIAAGHEVLEIDADGSLARRTLLAERTAGPLVVTQSGIVATTPSGTVYLIGSGHAKRIGTFGGDPGESGASTPDGHALLAVIDHQRVMALNLVSGTTEVRFGVTDQSLHGPVVFGADNALVLTTWIGVLLTMTAGGGEVRRTPLEPRIDTLVTDAGKIDFAALDESPPPVTDREGRIAFSRVGGRIGVVARDGTVALVAGPTCGSPAALAPAGSRRFVVACRDGAVLMLGQRAP